MQLGIWKEDPDSMSVTYQSGCLEDKTIWIFGRAEMTKNNYVYQNMALMKGVMAYPWRVFKRGCVCSYFQAQRLGKGQQTSIGEVDKQVEEEEQGVCMFV